MYNQSKIWCLSLSTEFVFPTQLEVSIYMTSFGKGRYYQFCRMRGKTLLLKDQDRQKTSCTVPVWKMSRSTGSDLNPLLHLLLSLSFLLLCSYLFVCLSHCLSIYFLCSYPIIYLYIYLTINSLCSYMLVCLSI